MKYKITFNQLYLPVKNNITGEILKESHSLKGIEYNAITVTYYPEKPFGKWAISALYKNNNQEKRLCYGKTRSEIKALVNDLNDFKFDPHLFLNQ